MTAEGASVAVDLAESGGGSPHRVTCGLRNGKHVCEQPHGHTDGYHRSSSAGWHCPWPSEPCPEDRCKYEETS